jgi:hypothetical protein
MDLIPNNLKEEIEEEKIETVSLHCMSIQEDIKCMLNCILVSIYFVIIVDRVRCLINTGSRC